MKRKSIYIFLIFAPFILSSCVTGGFDENPQLDELNAAIAKAPKIESIAVNGAVVERNQQSRRIVEAHVGDVLQISAEITSGQSAELDSLEVSRQYYGNEDPLPLDHNDADGFYELSGNTFVYDLTYTVPEEDDDHFHFAPGDVILVYFRAKNTLGNYGYKAFEIQITE
jgi:hypothetical protein